jgi:beta-galactosidase
MLFISFVTKGQTIKEKVTQKIGTLNTLINSAHTSGIETLKEELTIRTAEIFMGYADWDEVNINKNTSYFEETWHYKDNASQMANLLPDFERQDILTMLEASIVHLTKVINDEIIRKPTPNVAWENVTYHGDKLMYEGKPVFLADWTWKPGTSNFDEYHGQLDGFFITPNYVTNKNGTIKDNKLNEINNKASGKMGFIFINNRNVPQWAIDEYGADFVIKDDKNVRYTEYDIDHPGAKVLMTALIKGMIPQMSGKKYSGLGYMMCNEPHFINTVEANGNLSWASSSVSNYTIEAFKDWLQNKHTNIENLNTIWGTSFSNFNAVAITIPISVNLQGTAKWFDWMSFNMDRVTNWYQFIKDEIVTADPLAKVHLKIIPKHWTTNGRTTGLDVEALTRMSGIIGNDTGAVHRSAPWKTEHWESKYIFEWSEMGMAHDFFKSVSPNKMMINTESHFLSTKGSLNLYLNPLHSRATYWLAHTQGLNVSQTWYWSRREDGSPRNEVDQGYAGSNNHQPRVVNELHATIMDLNAHSEKITAFQKQRKPIRIFYTKASSINKPTHMDDVLELYESLAFNGIPLGFVTKDILLNENPEDWDVILVHKTPFVTQEDKEALQAYINAGGKVIMDNISFKKDEYGRAISGLSGSVTNASGAENIKKAAIATVDGFGNLPKVTLTETSSVDYPQCLWKVIEDSTGNQILSILNVGKVDAQIELNLKNSVNGVVVKDLLKGIDISNSSILKPYEVLFVELKNKDNILAVEDLNMEDEINVFPNPTAGKVSLYSSNTLENIYVSVMSLDGKCIFKKNFVNTQNVIFDLSSVSSGIYIVHVKSQDIIKSFKLILRN